MTDDASDSLPPEHIPFGDLLRWLERRLGRRPTLAEVAEIRVAQREASRRRSRRPPRPILGTERAPSSAETISDIMTGPEGSVMLAAIGMLPVLLAAVAQARLHDEWLTRPETIQRLADAVATSPRTPRFEAPIRRQILALRTYATWKLGVLPADERPDDGCMPVEVAYLSPDVAAAVNAITEDAVRVLLAQLDCASDSAARLRLRQLREEGIRLRKEYGDGIGWRTGSPPLGIVQPPPPIDEPDAEPDSDDDEGERPRPPSPKGGRR